MKKNYHRFECTTCDKSFSRKFTLRRHQLVHTKDKLTACPTCGRQFQRLDAMKRHQLVHRSSNTGGQQPLSPVKSPPPKPRTAGRRIKKSVPCSKCGMTFKSFDSLRKHRQASHQRVSTTAPLNWDQPSTSSHGQPSSSSEHFSGNSRRCPKCGKVFSRPYAMRRHLKSKHGDVAVDRSPHPVQSVPEQEQPLSDDDVLQEDPVECSNSENDLSGVEKVMF